MRWAEPNGGEHDCYPAHLSKKLSTVMFIAALRFTPPVIVAAGKSCVGQRGILVRSCRECQISKVVPA
jgi:hypothetical protein